MELILSDKAKAKSGKRKIWRLKTFRLLPLAFIVIISSCHNDNGSSHKTIFNINLDEGLTSLDPAFCRNQNTIWMDNQLYNGLVQIDDSMHVQPSVAKSWEISPDGKQYTFHLRGDVYFHDDPLFKGGVGRKAAAADFVYSFARLIDPKIASSGSWIFSDKVKDKHAFIALNDTTFRIQLKEPFPPLLTLLTS